MERLQIGFQGMSLSFPQHSSRLMYKQVDLKRDFENLNQIPCARSSLLYGIGGGVGLGAVRFISSKRRFGFRSSDRMLMSQGVWTGVSWSVFSFLGITVAAWCVDLDLRGAFIIVLIQQGAMSICQKTRAHTNAHNPGTIPTTACLQSESQSARRRRRANKAN
jgi:hypothetical protein